MTVPTPQKQDAQLYIYMKGFVWPMPVRPDKARADAETVARIFAGAHVWVLTIEQVVELRDCDSTQHEAYLADKANVLLPVPKPVWDSEESLSGVSW